MLTGDAAKLQKIKDVLTHPGAYHWSKGELVRFINRVIDEDSPIPATLSVVAEPVDYGLIHDAVFEDQ